MKGFISGWRIVLGTAVSIILGVTVVLGGYLKAVDDWRDVNSVKNSGLITQADILNRTHIIDLSDPDQFEIHFLYQAQSPSDGSWQVYTKLQKVSSAVFNSIEGCETLSEIFVPGCEIQKDSGEGAIVVICEEYNPIITTSECKPATAAVGEESFELQVCKEDQINNIFEYKLKGCDQVQVIYLPDDPNQSWILGTEPKSSWYGISIMIFGFLFLGGLIFYFGRFLTVKSETQN